MDRDAKLPLVAWRRDLEYEYLAASYQLTKLMELKLREREFLASLEALVVDLRALAQFSGMSGRENRPEDSMLAGVAELVISEVKSLLMMGIATSQYRERFLFFHQQMRRLGQLLGYSG